MFIFYNDCARFALCVLMGFGVLLRDEDKLLMWGVCIGCVFRDNTGVKGTLAVLTGLMMSGVRAEGWVWRVWVSYLPLGVHYPWYIVKPRSSSCPVQGFKFSLFWYRSMQL